MNLLHPEPMLVLLAILCLLSSSVAEFEDFLLWFRSNGGVETGIGIQSYSADYRGIECKQQVEENSQVLHIPLQLSLSASKASSHPIHTKIIASLGQPDLALIAILLYEKNNKDSFWKPYLSILPNQVRNALYFTKEELEAFQNPSLRKRILALQKQMNENYNTLIEKWNELHISEYSITIEDFMWASSIIDR